tara:strand:- start:18 stop:1199 length:1182 start_codon:yes stop_codon:yes gene_type:complete
MTTITFILPRDVINLQPFKHTPLSVLYLLTILEERFGDKIKLEVNDLRGVVEENEIYHVVESDLYLHSTFTPFMEETTGIVNKIREVFPGAKHVAGGPHVNCFCEESAKLFDSIVLNDGEESIVNLVNDFLNEKIKPIYRHEGIINYSDYPIANRKYLPKRAIVDTGLMQNNFHLQGASAIFSRGCPFRCAFCANHTYGAVHYRTPSQVIEEIEYLKNEYQVECLTLKDDNGIPVKEKIARPFLEAIGGMGIKWRGQSRTNGISNEMVTLAKEAGCVDLALGLESVSQRVLDLVNKKTNLEETKEYLQALKKTGIGVRMHLIFGLPGETENIVQETVDFINETEPDSVLLLMLTPMPGTLIYEHPEKFGMNISFDGWHQFKMLFGRNVVQSLA